MTETQQVVTPAKKTKTVPVRPNSERGLAAYAPSVADLEAKQRTPAQSVRVPIAKIDVPPSMTRVPLDDQKVAEIRAGFRSRGQEEDIKVKTRGPRFELVDGRHRLEAARLEGWQDLSAKIRDDVDDASAVELRHVINAQRRSIGPYEEALGFHDILTNQGLTTAELARRLGLKEDYVRGRLGLVRLPPEIGKRIGEPGFSVAHAEVLLPIADKPDLMKAVAPIIGKPENKYSRGLPSAERFAYVITNLLEDKEAVATRKHDDYRTDEVLRSKAFKERVEQLPTVTLGAGGDKVTLILDKEKFSQIEKEAHEKAAKLEEAEEKRDAARAGNTGVSDAARRKQLREAKIQRIVRTKTWDLLGKRVKSTVSLDETALRALAEHFGEQSFSSKEDRRRMAQLLELREEEVKQLDNFQRKSAAVNQIIARHAKEGTLPRFLLALLLCRVAPSSRPFAMDSPVWKSYAKHWTGATPDALRDQAREELNEAEAKKKAAAKAAPKSAGKRPAFFNELAADCTACGYKAVSCEPDGKLREHWPKGKSKPSCPGGKEGKNLRWSNWKGAPLSEKSRALILAKNPAALLPAPGKVKPGAKTAGKQGPVTVDDDGDDAEDEEDEGGED